MYLSTRSISFQRVGYTFGDKKVFSTLPQTRVSKDENNFVPVQTGPSSHLGIKSSIIVIIAVVDYKLLGPLILFTNVLNEGYTIITGVSYYTLTFVLLQFVE